MKLRERTGIVGGQYHAAAELSDVEEIRLCREGVGEVLWNCALFYSLISKVISYIVAIIEFLRIRR